MESGGANPTTEVVALRKMASQSSGVELKQKISPSSRVAPVPPGGLAARATPYALERQAGSHHRQLTPDHFGVEPRNQEGTRVAEQIGLVSGDRNVFFRPPVSFAPQEYQAT